MRKSSTIDLGIIESFLKYGVARDLNPADLESHVSGLVTACADGPSIGTRDACQALGLNGGGFLLDPRLPINQLLSSDRVLLFNHISGMILKGVFRHTLYIHTPCATAELLGLNLANMVESLFIGKSALKQVSQNPGLIGQVVSALNAKGRLSAAQQENARRLLNEPELVKVACLLQVNFGDGHNGVFALSGQAFHEWSNPNRVLEQLQAI